MAGLCNNCGRQCYRDTPKHLIRDNDHKFGSCFARVSATSGIKVLATPWYAPRAKVISERFLGSVRRECLDHPADIPREAALRHPQSVSGVLQSRTTALGDPAADSRSTRDRMVNRVETTPLLAHF